MRSNSSGVNITGLYCRGQVWLWNRQDGGLRVRLSLETTDHGAAVRKVLEYRAKPQVLAVGRWEFEVDHYLGDQEQRSRLSPSCARINTSLIQRMVRPDEGWQWETAQHSFVHVRVFLSFRVERHKMHENPAPEVRFRQDGHRFRNVFTPRVEVALLIDEAPDDDLRLILLLGFEFGMRKQEIISAHLHGWI